MLLRLGYGEEKPNYSTMYKLVQEAIEPELAEVAQLHDCKDRNLSRIRVGAVSRGRLVFTTKRDRHSIVRVA